MSAARLGNDERLVALRALDRQARLLERTATQPDFDEYVARERGLTPAFAGRSV